jgi:FKBP-type peptidyl-prolyl cis-trans isomerase FkpA
LKLLVKNKSYKINIYSAMNKKNVFFVFLSILLTSGIFLHSCVKDDSAEKKAQELKLLNQYIQNENITVTPTASGLYYIEVVAGTGALPVSPNWVEISFTARLVSSNAIVLSSDSAIARNNSIYNPYFLYGPNRISLSDINIKGLFEGVSLMKQGGKSRLIFPSSLGYGGSKNGNIPAYSSLILDVELHNVITDIASFENSKMTAYLTENGITDAPTASGLVYHEIIAGTGDFPAPGKKVTYDYVGTFLNGQVFDKSEGGTNYIIIGNSEVKAGIEEGIKLMKQGGTAKLVIPYNIAYGATGVFRYVNYQYYIAVWPYSTVVYDIEILDIE